MPWPSAVNTTGMDQDADSLPRADILDLTNKFNEVLSYRGANGGICELDSGGKWPQARMPDIISGDKTFSGNVSAYSDERLKSDIQLIGDALVKVMQLRGVTFVRTDVAGSPRQTGVIAQDVLRVLPEAVSGDETLAVAYGNMVGLLVEAIKELAARVLELETR